MSKHGGAPATDVERLDDNWAVLDRLVRRTESLARRGRDEQAAVAAMTAATFAWRNPSGVFASGPLEDVLARLGSDLPAPRGAAPTRPAGTRPRVLHVATQLYGTGGHTQMLSSWLRLDRAREHHVCVTGQEGRDVPDKISRVLAGPDALTLLDDGRPRLLDRAARLSELALDHDQVVLHVHPNDVVPAIALALPPGERPEVLLVNHADHVFWLGVHVADRIVNLRTSGARLNVERRGIPEARNALLVRPLVMRDRRLSRSAARAELGLPPDALVVASAADTYKYGAAGGETLLDVLLPVMRAHPEARLHVAGPEPDGDWSVLAAQGLGRAWGLLPDVHTLLEAADVYVDSHPFSSLTSMLEAAWLDTPVLTLRSPDERLGVLGADTPELDDDLVVAGSGPSWPPRWTACWATPTRGTGSVRAPARPYAVSTPTARGPSWPGRSWTLRRLPVLRRRPALRCAARAARPAAAAGDGQRRRPGAGRDAGRRVAAPVVAAPRRDRGPAAAHRPRRCRRVARYAGSGSARAIHVALPVGCRRVPRRCPDARRVRRPEPSAVPRSRAMRRRRARLLVVRGCGDVGSRAGDAAHRAGEADEQEEAPRGLGEGERVEEGQPARRRPRPMRAGLGVLDVLLRPASTCGAARLPARPAGSCAPAGR